jgi:hypothetical protein
MQIRGQMGGGFKRCPILAGGREHNLPMSHRDPKAGVEAQRLR